jgi:hypothetical protein
MTAGRLVGAIELRGTVLRSIFRPTMEDTRAKLLICGDASPSVRASSVCAMRQPANVSTVADTTRPFDG